MSEDSEKVTISMKAKIKTGIVLGGFTFLILLMSLGDLANRDKAKPQKQKPGAVQGQRYTPPPAVPQSAVGAATGNVAAGGALVAEKSAGVWASAKNKIAGWLDFSEEKKPAAVPAPATRSAVAVRPAAVAPPPAVAAAPAAVAVATPSAVAPAVAAPAVAVAAPAPVAASAAAPVTRPVAAAKPKPAPAESTPELDRLMHGLDGILKN